MPDEQPRRDPVDDKHTQQVSDWVKASEAGNVKYFEELRARLLKMREEIPAAGTPPPDRGSEAVSSERESLDETAKRVALRAQSQDTNHRGWLTWAIFALVALWLSFVGTLLMFAGLKAWAFQLTDTVLVAVLTTTTLNILALLASVTRYLFPKRP